MVKVATGGLAEGWLTSFPGFPRKQFKVRPLTPPHWALVPPLKSTRLVLTNARLHRLSRVK